MKKLIKGIVDFRQNTTIDYKDTFAKLALGQAPDTLFIACSDSRVAPNLFASTDPGDLFVVRNIGNMVPANIKNRATHHDDGSVAAALEFSLTELKVSHIIVCGHSECAAIKAIIEGQPSQNSPCLHHWLQHGNQNLSKSLNNISFPSTLAEHNKISQLNVLLQMEHLTTYPLVQKLLKENKLAIHGWWFDIAKVDEYAFEKEFNQFTLIDETEAERILLK